jgi:hypothetical protein
MLVCFYAALRRRNHNPTDTTVSAVTAMPARFMDKDRTNSA